MCTSFPSAHSFPGLDSVLRSPSTLSPPSPAISIHDLSTLCSSGSIPIFLHSGIKVSVSFSSSKSLSSVASVPSKCLLEEETSPSTPATASTNGTFGVGAPLVEDGEVEHIEDFGENAEHRDLEIVLAVSEGEMNSKTVDVAHAAGGEALSAFSAGAVPQREESLSPSARSIGTLETYPHFYEREDSLDVSLFLRREAAVLAPSPSRFALPPPALPPPTLEDYPDYAIPASESSASQNVPLRARLRSSLSKKLHRVTPRVIPSHAVQPASSGSEAQSTSTSPPPVSSASSPVSSPKSKWRGRPRGGSTATVASIQSTLSSTSVNQSPRLVPSQAPPILNIAALHPPIDKSITRQSLPVSLAWLKETVIELSFDQDGYRAVRPSFRLAGYAGPRDTDDDVAASMNHHLCSGQADFMPLKREVFAFHHGALETAPVLRRLTMKDDDTHDYISKQASLSLKSNGVYVVHGTESSHSHSPFHFDLVERDATGAPDSQMTLHWKLDYLVGDRRTDKGKLVPGEKTFTPLTFSCSPGLLHDSHKMKIGFRHMMKKSLVAKLTAERVEVPAPPLPHIPVATCTPSGPPPEQNPPPAVHVSEVPTATKRRSFLMGHRRVKSQASTKGPSGFPEMKPTTTSWDADKFIQAQSTLKRLSVPPPAPSRSRSSSCSSQAQSQSRHPGHMTRLIDATLGPRLVERHIVPRSMLASLFSDDSSGQSSEGVGASRPSSVEGISSVGAGYCGDMTGIVPRVPLSPPRYHARRLSVNK